MRAARKPWNDVSDPGRERAETAGATPSPWNEGGRILLARLAGRGEGATWNVEAEGAGDGRSETYAANVDAAVDPALLAQCLAERRRVLVLGGATPLIVGALQARRALEIDPAGKVDAEVKSFRVKATELTLQTAAAFIQIKADEVELFGERVLTRARGVAKTLARMISLN